MGIKKLLERAKEDIWKCQVVIIIFKYMHTKDMKIKIKDA